MAERFTPNCAPIGRLPRSAPYPAIPEMVIAIVIAVGSASVFANLRASWDAALAAVSIALPGVLYGLTVTVRGGQIGDIAYHLGVLGLLAATAILLLLPKTRAALRART